LTAPKIPLLARSVDYLFSKQLHEIDIGVLVTHDPDWRPEHHRVLDEQFRLIYRSSILHAVRTGRVPVRLFRRPSSPESGADRGDLMCRVAAADRLTVDADGQVYACVTLAESYQELPGTPIFERLKSLRLGKISDPEFERKLAGYGQAARVPGIFHGKERKHSSFGSCRECPYIDSCTVCPVSIAHQPGNTDPDRIPDFACSFNRVALKYRERFPAEPTAENLLAAAVRMPQAVAGRRRHSPARPDRPPA
jgi:sulfatase maturation enzyme AslB (radical SAM superfamily)